MNFEKLQKDMVAAMKARDKVRKEGISAMISAVKKAAIDKGVRDNITDDLVDEVLIKELKTAKEQVDTCPASRTDLLEEYQARFDIIKEYAPAMMGENEVKEYIEKNFSDLVASKNKGSIMKAVMADLKGKADGKIINQIVTELCK